METQAFVCCAVVWAAEQRDVKRLAKPEGPDRTALPFRPRGDPVLSRGEQSFVPDLVLPKIGWRMRPRMVTCLL